VEVLVVAWAALWVGIGYAVDRQVSGLADLGTTVVLAGSAIGDTADALDAAKDVPFVGERISELAAKARRTARSAVVNGRHARDDVRDLAVLLWITIAAAPTVPVFAWYSVSRLRRRR
jgi:hypothetical protein